MTKGLIKAVVVGLVGMSVACGAAMQEKAGDPTCVADGSFEADMHNCSGKPGAGGGAAAPGKGAGGGDESCKNACGTGYGNCTNNCMQKPADGRDGCMSACKQDLSACQGNCK